MKKTKVKILLIIFLLTVFFATMSNASYNNITMSVVEEPVCTVNFGSKSYVERSIISKNLDNKEITLQLKVTNNEEKLKPTGEVMLVIDNSKSMLEAVTDQNTREDLVIDSSKTLITNLLKDNDKLKIGVVSFSTNSDVSKEGTIEDAKLISELTNDTDKLISSVSTIEYNGPRTNLDSGITLAKKYFTDATDNTHKYIIILSDGVPNVAIDYDKSYFSDDVIAKTKSSLQSLSNSSDNVIVMLTGIKNGEVVASPSTKTYNEIIEEIFGTVEKPTVGKFYYITDDKIEETIKDSIYKDLLPVSQSFKDIKITDYFSKEIVDNYSFSYTKKPEIGEISSLIDKSTNSITWTIPELNYGETAVVEYTLKLNENYNSEIVGKVLDTNSKLDVTYTDNSNVTDTKSSTVTPKIKLAEALPTVIPSAGKYSFIGLCTLSLLVVITVGIRYFLIRIK